MCGILDMVLFNLNIDESDVASIIKKIKHKL